MRNTAALERYLVAALAVSFASAAGTQAQTNRIKGHARYEKIKGKSYMGYRELYETNLFLTPADDSVVLGRSRRLGTWDYNGSYCYNDVLWNGAYCIDNMDRVTGALDQPIPDGTYSILVNESLFYVVPKVITDVVLQGGQTVTLNPELPIDFSTWFFDDWVGKVEDGDYRPPSSPWYQTFIATGTSICGVTFFYAGEDPTSFDVAILEDNGNPNPINWGFLGERSVSSPGAGLNDNWVRFRSSQIPTVPGTTYAVRITGHGGVNNGGFQPFIRDKDGSSYVGGEAYDHTGTPQGHDNNVTVFTDNDETIVTMNWRLGGMGVLKEPNYWGPKWGQTFIAQGTSLAAVDFKASTGVEGVWEIDIRWKVYEGADASGPTGPQVGVTKITNAAWNPFAFHQGVSYNPGQIPLTPGQTYFIEFEVFNPPPEAQGFNPWIMDQDSYDGGYGYWWTGSGWDDRPNDDVNMTIVEYVPWISLDPPDAISRTVYLGDDLSNDTFTVMNIKAETLNYNIITDDADWLDVDPDSGSVTGAEQDSINVIYTVSDLPCAEHHATIEVTGNAYNSPQQIDVTVTVHTVGPDLDCDADVDQEDFGLFQACYTGGGVPVQAPECVPANFDVTNDVDQDDFIIFQACMSGPDVPADPNCAD